MAGKAVALGKERGLEEGAGGRIFLLGQFNMGLYSVQLRLVQGPTIVNASRRVCVLLTAHV